MRAVVLAFAIALIPGLDAQNAANPDVREIVRKSVEMDQANWERMKDYTWNARSDERHFRSDGTVQSRESSAWETVMLDGRPYRRMLERNGQPLSPAEQQKQQEKMDKSVDHLEHETLEHKQQRAARYAEERRREREFINEIPDAFDCRLEGSAIVDGHDTWVISGTPKPDYHPRTRDGKYLLKVRGKIWIDKSNYQWVRLEAQTTDTISWGLFLARLNPGAKLVFEQMNVTGDLWLPRRMYVRGSGRVGVLKKIAMDDEITWSDYHRFQVDSRVVPIAH